MSEEKRPKPGVLIVLDGWGVAPDSPGNAITQANTPVIDEITKRYPVMTIKASGEEVGLTWGQMGNSEVGHLAIGSGRIYYQTLPRIDHSITDGSFFENEAFLNAMKHAKKGKGTLHLIGLMSTGKVHAMNAHCYSLLELAEKEGLKRVAVHAILDGRDTLYSAGHDFINELEQKIEEFGIGDLATLSGRFYAMDRDNRWDRIEKAYNAIALGQSEYMTENALEAIKASYANEVYDEQFPPTVLTKNGRPRATIKPGDACIFFNFRPDRARQLTKAFVLPEFDKFPREQIGDLEFVTMTEYEKNLPVDVAYAPVTIEKSLAEVISLEGMKQLHIAETEKYAHVTFFLNGTHEEPFKGEDRIIVPSPKIANYNEQPEMSSYDLTDKVVKAIRDDVYDFYAINYANPDMVAHTGDLEATKKAVESVDENIGRIVESTLEKGGVVFITADHGNAEEVQNLQTGDMDKEHSTNPVPFMVIAEQFEGQASPAGEAPGGDLALMPPVGMLADVAPTILAVLGVPKPEEMTGVSLL